MAVNDLPGIRLVEEIVVAEHCMTDGFRARLVTCCEIEEAAGDVANSKESIRQESIRMEVGKTREESRAPVRVFSPRQDGATQRIYQS